MASRAVDGLLERLQPRDGVLDLRRVDWVRPAVMVGTAALAHRAHAAGLALQVRAPARVEPAGYAARMRLGRMLDRFGAVHDLPVARERDQHENLIELSIVDGDRAAARLARLVHTKIAARDAALARALHGSVGEIGANAHEHSGTVGFMAAQTLPRRRELLLAVADAGVGIRATLAHLDPSSDEAAIELATREHISRFDRPERGRGLPTALRLVTGCHGSIYIASGSASVRHFAATRRYLRGPRGYQGTIVEIRIPLP